jgi:hypothetical protein
LTLLSDGRCVEVPVQFRDEHCGFTGVVHGGLLSTVLDEVMAWVIGVNTRSFAFAAELNVRFEATGDRRGLFTAVYAPCVARLVKAIRGGQLENPAAAEGQGLSVNGLRTGAVVAGSALMGLAGAFLTLAAFNAFYANMVNGRGWVCVALVVFASWRPGKALLGALLFAFFDALQLRLQQSGGGVLGLELPYQLYLALPYAMAIVALVLVARRASYPQALMKPYRKGER